MAITGGYCSVEFYIRSPLTKFFEVYCDMAGLQYVNVEQKELKLEPEETMKVMFRIEGFQISNWYKTFEESIKNSDVTKWQDPDWYTKLEGTMTVFHTEYNNGGGPRRRALWTVGYEKILEDIPDPRFIAETTANYFQQMDESIVANP